MVTKCCDKNTLSSNRPELTSPGLFLLGEVVPYSGLGSWLWEFGRLPQVEYLTKVHYANSQLYGLY